MRTEIIQATLKIRIKYDETNPASRAHALWLARQEIKGGWSIHSCGDTYESVELCSACINTKR